MRTLRGTTPYHVFPLPLPVSMIAQIYITYAQYGEILFEKTLSDCEILGDKQVRIHLTQEETLMFSECDEHSHKVEAQLTALSKSGERYENDIVKISIGRTLKDVVIYAPSDPEDPEDPGGSSGDTVITSHKELSDRGAENQHPITAITGLEEELNTKVNISNSATVSRVGEIAVFSSADTLECCGHTVQDFALKKDFPVASESDEGKFLTVVGGRATWTDLPSYEGSYVVTPQAGGKQILQTSKTYLNTDIVVQEIPYAEVSNDYDGKTVTIG